MIVLAVIVAFTTVSPSTTVAPGWNPVPTIRMNVVLSAGTTAGSTKLTARTAGVGEGLAGESRPQSTALTVSADRSAMPTRVEKRLNMMK